MKALTTLLLVIAAVAYFSQEASAQRQTARRGSTIQNINVLPGAGGVGSVGGGFAASATSRRGATASFATGGVGLAPTFVGGHAHAGFVGHAGYGGVGFVGGYHRSAAFFDPSINYGVGRTFNYGARAAFFAPGFGYGASYGGNAALLLPTYYTPPAASFATYAVPQCPPAGGGVQTYGSPAATYVPPMERVDETTTNTPYRRTTTTTVTVEEGGQATTTSRTYSIP